MALRRLRISIQPILLYLTIFFLIWIARATIFYTIDERITSDVLRQLYSNTIRVFIWVVPVFVYLHFVDRVRPVRYLLLNAPIDQRGLWYSSVIVIAYLSFGVGLDYAISGNQNGLSITASQPWYMLVFLLPIAPIAEEILFRGFVLRKIQDFVFFWPANLITSVLFTAIHWPNWLYTQMPLETIITSSLSIFVLSCLLGYLVQRTNSLWPSIITHILNNLVAALVRIG
ncbi:MAG: CPBP family intramembrane glutamic endopeptidase [Chloroflexota bacterium]